MSHKKRGGGDIWRRDAAARIDQSIASLHYFPPFSLIFHQPSRAFRGKKNIWVDFGGLRDDLLMLVHPIFEFGAVHFFRFGCKIVLPRWLPGVERWLPIMYIHRFLASCVARLIEIWHPIFVFRMSCVIIPVAWEAAIICLKNIFVTRAPILRGKILLSERALCHWWWCGEFELKEKLS